jgi:HTH-like domain
MVSPSSRRRAAKYLVEEGLANAAQAYRALGLARSSYYLVGQKRPSSQKLERKIITLSEQHPRYGYRRITALMRRKGKPINAKRVQRVRRQAGLEVKERQKRTRRLGNIEAGAMECWITAPWASSPRRSRVGDSWRRRLRRLRLTNHPAGRSYTVPSI